MNAQKNINRGTAQSPNLVRRIQAILEVTGYSLQRQLDIPHCQSFYYLLNGAKISPYIVERLIMLLSPRQLLALRKQLIEEAKNEPPFF